MRTGRMRRKFSDDAITIDCNLGAVLDIYRNQSEKLLGGGSKMYTIHTAGSNFVDSPKMDEEH